MKLSDIKGLKEKRIAELEKAGIMTPMDLISCFPAKYVNLTDFTDFQTVKEGDDVLFSVVFSEKPKTSYVRKNLCLVKVKFEIGGKNVYCTWFNQKFFASSIVVGERYYIMGKAALNGKSVEIKAPKAVRESKCNGNILVIYRPVKKLSGNIIASAIRSALEKIQIVSFIPEEVRERYSLMPLWQAYRAIHMPTNMSETDNAKRSVSIEYMNYTLCVYSIINKQMQAVKPWKYMPEKEKMRKKIAGLPFELTSAQKKAVGEIISDMQSTECMNRFLQGDVGSGKTIVAFLSMYFAGLSGYQSVIMCPTELLAKQHYQSFLNYFPELAEQICLITSSMKKDERENVLNGIKTGKYKFIAGTHSVFSDDVVFSALSLVITDEQHRFGVNQRSSLENKSEKADCLVMSATPIPRTLALTLYGDLKRSVIDVVPDKKASISTKIVPERKINDMWRYFVECAERDERTYVVCPRIDDDDENDLVSCKKLYSEKKKLGAFVGLLHGQMSEKEKTAAMNDFTTGKVKILISTTVVEVGVDVPQAVNIAVYNPDRYGLSQLHQLRGRVGRGEKHGSCFLIANDISESAFERLHYLERCSDGFALAEYDFDSRGAGDFLGLSQHGKGDMPVSAADLKVAKEISLEVLKNDDIRKEIALTIKDNRYEYYKNITLN